MQPGDIHLFRGGDGIALIVAHGPDSILGYVGFPPDSPIGQQINPDPDAFFGSRYAYDYWADDLVDMPEPVSYAGKLYWPSGEGEPSVGNRNSHDPIITTWHWIGWAAWEGEPGGTVEGMEENIVDAARVLSQYARNLLVTQ